ncbi:hypothetical protein D3C75_1172720 [compost metagenome]
MLQCRSVVNIRSGINRGQAAGGHPGIDQRLTRRMANQGHYVRAQRSRAEGGHTYANHIDATLHRALLKYKAAATGPG